MAPSVDDFQAIVVRKAEQGFAVGLERLGRANLPEGDIIIQAAYSSLNYKDGLALTDSSKVLRSFPIVPGIDLAGTIIESNHAEYSPGEQVILTGWGVGERYWGGYTQFTRVRSEWLVPLPKGLSLKQAMAIGTAGLTAMLSVMALEEHGLSPRNGRELVVTGAAGGVGSIAVALLAQLGYEVAASTGRPETHDYLRRLGASNLLDRRQLSNPSNRPLESERWGGAVDTVGGETLANILRSMAHDTSVAACGLAGGTELPTSVLPFILRGVNLLGINSVMCPYERRQRAWQRLAHELPLDLLAEMTQEVPLSKVQELAPQILAGKVRGRVVVDLLS
jgi:acrylyl-CoA reductase (NADPH)